MFRWDLGGSEDARSEEELLGNYRQGREVKCRNDGGSLCMGGEGPPRAKEELGRRDVTLHL